MIHTRNLGDAANESTKLKSVIFPRNTHDPGSVSPRSAGVFLCPCNPNSCKHREMDKRFFSDQQKKMLFLLAGGKCQICGNDLKKGWHADHVTPWSKGGDTTLENGQALCPSCNQKKYNNMQLDYPFQPRAWQAEALEEVKRTAFRTNRFLAVAGVGSGKTYFAQLVAHYFFSEREFDSVIVVSPSDGIRANWTKDFLYNFDIDLDKAYNFKYNWSSDFDGLSLTFQSLVNPLNVEMISRYVTPRTLLIVDEVHHAGESKNWGDSIDLIGQRCGFTLLLSGTPTRSDNNRIPFVEYKQIGENQYQLISNYTYGYADSVKDGVCCPVRFHKIAGEIETFGGVEYIQYEDESDTSKKTLNKALSVNHNTGYVWQMFEQADEKLLEINKRRGLYYAGLIVCKSIADAEYMHRTICREYGDDYAVLVTSDQDESTDKINDFKESTIPWIVSVRQVSEGVDISRIRVIVYATNYETPLFFMQVIGRGVRNAMHKANDIDTCHVYIPEYKTFVDNANKIEEELTHIYEDLEKEAKERAERGEQLGLPLMIDDIILNATATNTGSIYAGEQFTMDDMNFIASIANQKQVTAETAMAIITAFNKRQAMEEKAEVSMKRSMSDQKEALKKRIRKVVGQIQYHSGSDFSDIHWKLNSACGIKSSDEASKKQLDDKLRRAVQWLNQVKEDRA